LGIVALTWLTGHHASIFCGLTFFPRKHMRARRHVGRVPDKDPSKDSVQRWRSMVACRGSGA
jgi:hypothetical protein